ncbi:MAG: hypothetical protein IJR10_00885 [Clostridia bacterium]|nr:hypothetical protein [Clostridia bacterium]
MNKKAETNKENQTNKTNKTIRIIAAALVIAAIFAATFVPIAVQGGGAWYEKAGLECADVAVQSNRILKLNTLGLEPEVQAQVTEKLIEALKD